MLVDDLLGHDSVPPDPLLVALIQILSAALPDFLNHGDNEKACQFWKQDRAQPGQKTEIWHADVWNTIPAADGHQFFNQADDSEDLHLGVTISIDWYFFTPSRFFSSRNI
jgi:hypothetical protein